MVVDFPQEELTLRIWTRAQAKNSSKRYFWDTVHISGLIKIPTQKMYYRLQDLVLLYLLNPTDFDIGITRFIAIVVDVVFLRFNRNYLTIILVNDASHSIKCNFE